MENKILPIQKDDAPLAQLLVALAELREVNKKLMGLLESEYKYKVWRVYDHFPSGTRQERVNESWQSYCKEHNLTIYPTDEL